MLEISDSQKLRRNRIRERKAIEKGNYEKLKVEKSNASIRNDDVGKKRIERTIRRTKDRIDYYDDLLGSMPGSKKSKTSGGGNTSVKVVG